VKIIKAQMEFYQRKNKEAACHAQRQAQNIDNRISFVVLQAPPRNFEKIS
jgi:hypothetical protein